MSNFSLRLRQSAARHPDRVAIVEDDTELSYAALDERVDRLARGLLARGVGSSTTVAVLSQNCTAFLELYFAVMRVGAVFLPINFRLSAHEIAYQLERARVDMMFVGEGLVELAQSAVSVAEVRVSCVALEEIPRPRGWEDIRELRLSGSEVVDAPKGLDDVQRIMFTSGTTSHPKAALTTHGQVWIGALVRATEFRFTEHDVNLVNGPLYHAGALDHFATTHLVVGGSVVVTRRFDAQNVLRVMERRRVTNTWLSPTMARMVSSVPDWEVYDVSALRMLLLSGEKCPEHLLRRIQDAWPTVGVNDCYGLTEASLATFVPANEARRKLGSVGRASLGTRVRVVAEDGSPCAPGDAGGIQISGDCVFPGYFGDEDATDAAFVDGWLVTGDVGYLDEEGYLFVVDRAKDMIRSGAENIASSEIERVVYEVEGVQEVAVIARPDEKWGEVPVAVIVPDSERGVSVDAVLSHARERLAKFKVPKAVHFVDALPRTPSGKVMKRVLRDSLTPDDGV